MKLRKSPPKKKKLEQAYNREETRHDKAYESENKRHEKKHIAEMEEAMKGCDKKKKK